MNTFDLIAAGNFFIINPENDLACRLQTTSIQFFEIGSWVYNSFYAIETLIVVRQICSVKVRWEKRKKYMYLRHFIYSAITTIFNVVIISIINAKNDYELLGFLLYNLID
jgi:hypothetical protein